MTTPTDDMPQPAGPVAATIAERIAALEAETRRQAAVLSATQDSFQALIKRQFTVERRVHDLEVRIERRDRTDD